MILNSNKINIHRSNKFHEFLIIFILIFKIYYYNTIKIIL